MKPFPSRAHGPLLAAIRRLTAAGGGGAALIVEAVRAEDWASLTFAGEKHWLELRLDGSAAAVAAARDRLERALADAEIEVPGHIVADIALTGATLAGSGDRVSCRLKFEALTIVD